MKWIHGTMKDHLRKVRNEAERKLYLTALEFTGGNISYTADILELSRKQVQLRLKALEIEVDNYRDNFRYRERGPYKARQKRLKPLDLLELKKKNANSLANKAIDLGLIQRPDKCEKCSKKSGLIQAHHPDYEKPLEIQWLCVKCHNYEHHQPKKKVKRLRIVKTTA